MGKDLNCELIQSIFQLKQMIHKGFGVDFHNKEISTSEMILMKEIINNTKDSKDNVEISDIKGHLSITKGAVSQKLATLEKKGYLLRSINKNNRRSVIVTLTPKGKNLMKEHYDKFNEKLEIIISRLGEDNVRSLIKIVNDMTEISKDLNNEIKASE